MNCSPKIQMQQFEDFIKLNIPIAEYMKMRIASLSEDQVTLKLPLDINRNHKGTMFGGSLYSGAALSGYALFLASMQINKIDTKNIVIAEGKIRYILPVDSEAEFIASWSEGYNKVSFLDALEKKGRAKAQIEVIVNSNKKRCAEFLGSFVAKIEK